MRTELHCFRMIIKITRIQKYFFSQIIFQMHKSCSYYYRHSYNMARQCAGSVLRLSNLDNVSRKFQNSYIRKLPFPHEDMFVQFLDQPNDKMLKKIISPFPKRRYACSVSMSNNWVLFSTNKSKFPIFS